MEFKTGDVLFLAGAYRAILRIENDVLVLSGYGSVNAQAIRNYMAAGTVRHYREVKP